MPDSPSDSTTKPAAGARRRWGNKPGFFLIGILVAGVFTFGWGSALMNYGQSSGGVPTQTVAWHADSKDEASITFEVSGDDPVSCVIKATDEKHAEVGRTETKVGPNDRDVTATVDTVREAATVEVVSCREQGSAK